MDGAYNMFCPGSLGIVDVGDISKVVFEGAVARLAGGIVAPTVGGSLGGVEAHAVAGIPGGQHVSATIRYPVPDRFAEATVGIWAIIIRWRGGDGRVVAKLMETPVPQYPNDNGDESTRPLLTFDSDELGSDGFGPIFGPPTPHFRTGIRGLDATDPPSPLSGYTPDLAANTYHLEVTLTGLAAIEVGPTPPAVAAIGITQNPLEERRSGRRVP